MSYDKENIFAKIIRGEIPCDKIFEDDEVLAFNDINPCAPVHVLVIPKGEFTSFDDFAASASAQQASHFFKKVQEIAEQLGVVESGYRLLSNHGKDASQSVPHFHVHILAGKQMSHALDK